jgi:RHS repeat-associated protein
LPARRAARRKPSQGKTGSTATASMQAALASPHRIKRRRLRWRRAASARRDYNYFRDYEPQTGRYVESDPIGLDGGISTYGYAELNPLFFIDPDGLSAESGSCGCCSNVSFAQKEGGVVGATVRCCGGSPVACVNPNLCDGLSPGACSIRKDCTKRHEQMHVDKHSTCSGVSEGGPAVPKDPFTKSSSECEAYRFDYGSCLSIAKCGGERTCIAEVKRMRAFAKKQRDT